MKTSLPALTAILCHPPFNMKMALSPDKTAAIANLRQQVRFARSLRSRSVFLCGFKEELETLTPGEGGKTHCNHYLLRLCKISGHDFKMKIFAIQLLCKVIKRKETRPTTTQRVQRGTGDSNETSDVLYEHPA